MAKKENGVVPASQGIIKGNLESIPEQLLNRSRTHYNWDEFEVGDHKVFPFEEATKARSSAIAFGRGTKDRAPRAFATRQVTKKVGDKEVKMVEVWRISDPTPATVKAESNQQTVN